MEAIVWARRDRGYRPSRVGILQRVDSAFCQRCGEQIVYNPAAGEERKQSHAALVGRRPGGIFCKKCSDEMVAQQIERLRRECPAALKRQSWKRRKR